MALYIGKGLIVLALIFIAIGVLGIFRYKDFYSRILISSKVEVLGLITLMVGVMVCSGFSFFTLKVSLILVLVALTNPLVTHAIARSAYVSGYAVNKDNKET